MAKVQQFILLFVLAACACLDQAKLSAEPKAIDSNTAEHDCDRPRQTPRAAPPPTTVPASPRQLAYAEESRARLQVDRLRGLFDRRVIPRQELDDAEKTLQEAERKVIDCLKAAMDEPDSVSVRIVSGMPADADNPFPAEPWIATRAAAVDAPKCQATSEWVPLDGRDRDVYQSMQGGRRVTGQFRKEGDKLIVRITGHAIGQSPRDITLPDRAGEGTVVKLTNYPPPGNVFIAVRIGKGPQK